jgi:hypothetical protein
MKIVLDLFYYACYVLLVAIRGVYRMFKTKSPKSKPASLVKSSIKINRLAEPSPQRPSMQHQAPAAGKAKAVKLGR